MEKRKVEILAPAGSIDGLYASLQMGADAVYVGAKKFGARAFADNPSVEELCEALIYAHLRDKKIYLTTNTLLSNSNMNELYDLVAPLYEAGLDACIVQDIGVLSFLHENFPEMDLHASTQMTLFSGEEAELYRPLGITRYVPARELTIEEIREARQQTELEIEVFVHGALCYCYSGQCLMSEVIGGRSGNHGMCAQPCRFPFASKYGKGHLLSAKDICTLPYIPDLVDAGIDSFKIEGRMKRKEYSAYISYLYRKYVDFYLQKGRDAFDDIVENKESELWKDYRDAQDLYNRGGFSRSYLFEREKSKMMDTKKNGHYGVPAGVVREVGKDYVRFETREELHYQDVLEFRKENGQQAYEYTVKNGAKKNTLVKARYQRGCHLYPGQHVYRTKNTFLLENITKQIGKIDDGIALSGKWKGIIGQPVSFTVMGCGKEVTVLGSVLQKSQNRPVTEDDVRQKLSAMGTTRYEWEHLELFHEPQSFIPLGELKKIRREAINLWEKETTGRRRIIPKKFLRQEYEEKPFSCHVMGVSNGAQLELALETPEESVLIHLRLEDFPCEEWECLPTLLGDRNVAISIPRILRGQGWKKWLSLWEKTMDIWAKMNVTTIFINSHRALLFARKYYADACFMAEQNMYQENDWARRAYHNMGIGAIMPQTYGRIAVMVSEGCVLATTKGCQKRKERIEIMSPKKDCFVVVNHCNLCYNTIYTKAPVRNDNSSQAIRLEFTWETKEEMRKVMGEWNLL